MNICTFCKQESPDDAIKCSFCGNTVVSKEQAKHNPEPVTTAPLSFKLSRSSNINISVKRGSLLTIYLVLCSVSSLASAFTHLVHWEQMTAKFPVWAIFTLRAIVFLRPFSVVAIWLWSRSGVVFYIFLSAVASLVFLQLGDVSRSVKGLGVIILIALVWSKWRYMIWGISLRSKVETSEINAP